MKQDALKSVCHELCEVLNEYDLTNQEACEVVLNFFGLVVRTAGMTVHDAVGGVMTYYKTQDGNN